MKILIDADACPVKDIVLNIAKKYKLDVVIVKNICHEIHDDYAKVITVDQGRDVADITLINNTSKGDIVITQDYGVAAMALAKNARAIHHNGWAYTEENMDELLMKRYIGQEERRKHKKYTKIPKRTKEDDRQFEDFLETQLGDGSQL